MKTEDSNPEEIQQESEVEKQPEANTEKKAKDETTEIPLNVGSESVKIIKKGNDNSQLNISYDFLFKVSLIGDSGTGKTSILMRFIDNVFKEETTTTIGVDFKIVSFDLGANTYAKMQIWDTCGSERFASLTATFLKTCSAFILVFDLTRPTTFNNITNWIKTINENTKPKFLILIGNKADLVDERKIEKKDVLEFCEKNDINYIEISAKTNNNVEKIFKEVAWQLYSEIKKKNGSDEPIKEFQVGGFKNIKIDGEQESRNNKKKDRKCC